MRLLELQSNRDTALRALLTNDRDRLEFDGHAMELRRREESASWQVMNSFRGDAEQLGVTRVTAIADVLDRRDSFATYMRSVKR